MYLPQVTLKQVFAGLQIIIIHQSLSFWLAVNSLNSPSDNVHFFLSEVETETHNHVQIHSRPFELQKNKTSNQEPHSKDNIQGLKHI